MHVLFLHGSMLHTNRATTIKSNIKCTYYKCLDEIIWFKVYRYKSYIIFIEVETLSRLWIKRYNKF